MIKITMKIVVLLLVLCTSITAQKYTINGQIQSAKTGEDLISANIYCPKLELGSVSNVYGFYSLTLESGVYDLVFSYVGYDDVEIKIDLSSDVTKDIELSEAGAVLGELVISADKEKAQDKLLSTEMSADEVSIETVKKLPALFGEIDIIKVIQLLPGVKSVGEGGSGFYVRGGNVDQNLVLLDEAPIYNASHILGFFSSFNPDAIKDMKLYKGAIPAQYGGRLSSVLDIRMKDGNSKRFAGSAGLGTLMSRLAIEAPISDKGSFMLAGRRSYIDVVADLYQSLREKDETTEENKFYFYDLNAKANYRINKKNRIFASGYFGKDVLSFDDEDETVKINWSNTTSTLRWNHLFSPKLFSNLTYYYSNYNYFLGFEEDVISFDWDSNLREHSLKADFGAYLNPKNTMRFGLHIIQHKVSPGKIQSFNAGELIDQLDIQSNLSYESAVYLSNEQELTDRIKIDYGLRFSLLHNVGPQEVYNLDNNYNIIDTTIHTKGVYNTYKNLEPRINIRYSLDETSSIKSNYTRTAQYIQLASNGNFATPFDIWFSSSPLIKPQLADQIAVGYFKNLANNSIEFSAEMYYRWFYNSIDFKDHAELLLNTNLEADLRIGKAKAYGLELMAKKNKGRLSGWISYTYSKAQKNIETINNNDWYNTKYDRPHDLSIVASYELTERIALGSSFVYSSGSPVTFPTGKYSFLGVAVPIYSERNGERLPDYHRLDFSMTLQGKKNKTRRFQSQWVFSIYNLYDRRNAFAINFKQEDFRPNVTYAEKQAIFSIVPSITYNCKF